MTYQGANSYLRTKVLTATPEQLQMMLYDGAIRFCEQARAALAEKNFEQSYNLISRVQRIIMELQCTLKRDVFPELCGRLSALYNFVYRKLVEANIEHQVEALEEALRVLRYQRDTWGMLLAQLGRDKAAAMANRMEMPEPSEQMERSISVQG
jgi:flagellar secretion chaperone FliS